MISTYQEQLLRAGYTLSINGTADVKLLTIPSYFGKCLNMDDFYEILEKIDEQPTASKHITKSMYYACATKACHKAIRFGDSLTTKQMKDVVCNLKKLANPWVRFIVFLINNTIEISRNVPMVDLQSGYLR